MFHNSVHLVDKDGYVTGIELLKMIIMASQQQEIQIIIDKT